MKVIITESQLQELFDSTNVYDVEAVSRQKYPSNEIQESKTEYRYVFTTKDNLKYRVMLMIRENGWARIDFDVVGSGVFSDIQLINKYDSIKVFNTIKSILEKHKPEIDTLVIHSTEDRNMFYKKLLKYMNIPYDDSNSRTMLAFLNPSKENLSENVEMNNDRLSDMDEDEIVVYQDIIEDLLRIGEGIEKIILDDRRTPDGQYMNEIVIWFLDNTWGGIDEAEWKAAKKLDKFIGTGGFVSYNVDAETNVITLHFQNNLPMYID